MAKVQFTEGMFKRAAKKGKITLGEYVRYKACLYMVTFFDIEKKEVTLKRMARYNRGGYKDISFEELFNNGNRLTRKEVKKQYSYII